MNLLKTIFLIVFFILTSDIYCQLKEFEIHEVETPQSIPIFPNNPDDAAIIIYSSIPNLNFESNTGGIIDIKGSSIDGKYIVIIRPEKQIVTIKLRGYREAQIRLMVLQSKTVQYFSIEEEKIVLTAGKGKFILNSIPQGAEFEVDGLPIRSFTPYESNEFRAETYKITIHKNGYETQAIYLTIEPGKIISKTVELVPDVSYLEYKNNIESIFSSSTRVKNLNFEQDGNSLVIYYDLEGDTQKDYEVQLLLERIDKTDIIITPDFISGNIGKGKFVGRRKKIIWEINKQFPNGFGDLKYKLELFVEKDAGLSWYYYVGGAVVTAGGVVIAILASSSPKGDDKTTTETLVEPPARP